MGEALTTIWHLLLIAWTASFSPNGYIYAHGTWVGYIVELEENGYLFKTVEGKMRTQNNPVLGDLYKYKILDCAGEREFSVDPKDKPRVLPLLYEAMELSRPVIVSFDRTSYPMEYWHGMSRVFVKNIEPLK